MGSDKYTVCDICGKKVKARGIAGHKALKHGVVEKKVVRHSGTRVNNSGDDSSKSASTQVKDTSTQDIHTSTRVLRPSDYVKKKEEVVEGRVKVLVENPEKIGFKQCSKCGNWYKPMKDGAPDYDICWTCLFKSVRSGRK